MTREQHIERLERSMEKWRELGLDACIPDVYAKFMADLQALKDGAEFVVYKDREMLMAVIAYVGGSIPNVNYRDGFVPIPVKNPITVERARELAREMNICRKEI